jgi:hypothetical protein
MRRRSAEERQSGTPGTTDPVGHNAGTGDMADQPSSTGTGATSTGSAATGSTGAGTGYERERGAHRGRGYEEREYEGGISPASVGGMLLAAVLMIFSGLIAFFDGIVGIIHGTFFPRVSNYAFAIGPTGRGIVNLILGALIFAAGVSLLLGMLWARVVGILLAVLIGIYNFLILPWYPIWAIILIALNVYIIWALARGGRGTRRAY